MAAPHLDARHRYTAGTDAERLAGLRWALEAPGVRAAWFARGGYGTARLLPGLAGLRVDNRLILGFSDATALLVGPPPGALAVHAPVLHSLARLPSAASLDALRALLLDGRPTPLPGRHLAGPRVAVRGPVVGGNLAVLASLCGTPWALRARGAIVVLEEVNEAPYRLDRLAWQLREAGCLDGVAGIAIGRLLGCEPPDGAGWSAEDVLAEAFADLGVPVVGGLPVGHGPDNLPFVEGLPGVLDAGGLVQDPPGARVVASGPAR